MTTPVVELRGVSRTYPGTPPVEALKPVDLTLPPGSYVAVTGRSGSGKSTLLNLLGLLDTPTGGQYLLDGVDTVAIGEGRRAAMRATRLGFVFQAYHLLPYRDCVENVMLALLYGGHPAGGRRARAEDALARVGMSHRRHAVPSTLSGGEQQRVAVARALVNDPSVLLCDEPTGNLDSVTAASILDLLDHLHGAGITVVVVTHDADVAARAERRIVIGDGVVREVDR